MITVRRLTPVQRLQQAVERSRLHANGRTYQFDRLEVCEHCAGLRSRFYRVDADRGRVCERCDETLDEAAGLE